MKGETEPKNVPYIYIFLSVRILLRQRAYILLKSAIFSIHYDRLVKSLSSAVRCGARAAIS